MVIYENIDGEYYCTQITMSFTETNKIKHKTTLTNIWDKYRKQVVELSNDEVLITGNTSTLGDGVFKREEIQDYLVRYL